MKQKKTLIVFDIDGTLTDSVVQHQAAFVSALQQMGVREINTDFKVYKHHTDSHIAKVIYELDRNDSFDREQLSVFEDLLRAHISTTDIREITGALQMVNLIQQQTDFAVCYATGSLYKPAVYKLNQAGITFTRSQLVASNEIEDRESIVLAAIEQAKLHYQQEKFDRIISIGDGLWDLLTAQNLGLEFIGVGTVHKETMLTRGSSIHFDDWSAFNLDTLMPSTFKS